MGAHNLCEALMIGRLAGQALGLIPKSAKYLTKGLGKGELALRLGQDALGGAMVAAYTPGDLGDKIIAGTGSALGGAAGGLALGKIGGTGLIGTGLDMAGSIGGDMVGSMVAEQAMKGKSALQGQGFTTPYEKLNAQQQAELAGAIKEDILRQYGLMVPGAPVQYAIDPSSGQGVA